MSDGPYNPGDDKINGFSLDDTRKNEISLHDLNRLKKLKAYRHLEDLKRRDSLEMIYGTPDEGDGGDFGA